MSVSGQVSATSPPHRRTRHPEPRTPALNSANAWLRDQQPDRTAPRAAAAGSPVARGPRPPADPGHRVGTGARDSGARTARVRGSTGSGGHGSPVDSSSPRLRAVPGITPKTAPDEERCASRVVLRRGGARPGERGAQKRFPRLRGGGRGGPREGVGVGNGRCSSTVPPTYRRLPSFAANAHQGSSFRHKRESTHRRGGAVRPRPRVRPGPPAPSAPTRQPPGRPASATG